MIDQIKRNLKDRALKKDLTAFLDEMDRNLELFYVMDQRQFITKEFEIACWPKVNGLDLVKKHEPIRIYVLALESFNKAYRAYKDFETWYASDMNHKTPDNAKKVHALKNDLDSKLKSLDAVIIPAGQALEKEMLQLGFLRS